MSSIHTLMEQVAQMSASAEATSKTAADNIPTEGHPTDSFDDRATITHGPEISESGAEQRELLGQMAGAAEGQVNPEEDEPTTIDTELHHGGDSGDPALKPGAGVDDPGPDSEHPASPNNTPHKYASINDPLKLVEALQAGAVSILSKLAADPSALEAPLKKTINEQPKTAATPEAPADENPLVTALRSMLPTEELITSATTKVASLYAPYVEEGIRRANLVYNYLSLVDTNPKLAADMMGLPPEAAAEGGMPPEAAPADAGAAMPPEAAGGEMAGGEGDSLDDLLMLIEQVAQQNGIPPEALAQELASLLGGGGEGGGELPPEAAGGEMPPEPAGEEVAPASEAPAEPKTASSKKRSSKTAAAPGKKTASRTDTRSVAMALLQEIAARQ